MRTLLLLTFILCSTCAKSQKIALLHKDFKQPIIFTDSLTVQQISSGYFALEINAVDTFYASLKYLKEMIDVRQRAKMQSFQFKSLNTTIYTERVPFSYGDRYTVNAKTKIGELTSSLDISKKDLSNIKNSKTIEKLMAYIAENKSLFKSPKEIHPKMYEVIVITD